MTVPHYNFKECNFPPLLIDKARKHKLTEKQTRNLRRLFYSELSNNPNDNLYDVLGTLFELGRMYERTVNTHNERL